MEEYFATEYSDSEESAIRDAATVKNLCKKYKFPGPAENESNHSSITLTDFLKATDGEESFNTDSDLVNKFRLRLDPDESRERSSKCSTLFPADDDMEHKLENVVSGPEEVYFSTMKIDWKKKMSLLTYTDTSLPKNAVAFFSGFRCLVFINQILSLLNLFLEVLILGGFPLAFPRKTIVQNDTLNQWLSIIYLFEISFPIFVSMFGIFAGAFDPKHLRNFSRLAVCHIVFINIFKLLLSYVLYMKIFDDTLEAEMFDELNDYHNSVQMNLDNVWDSTQKFYKCCGVKSYEDWFGPEITVGNNETADQIPKSCCGKLKKPIGKSCFANAKKLPGCLTLVQEQVVSLISAVAISNWIQLIFLLVSVLLAFKVWKIICVDDDYVGSEGWQEARGKYKRQTQLSFFFVCVPSTCWKINCRNFDTKIHPVTSNHSIVTD